MRGRVKLHNLGSGFFGEKFEDLEKRINEKTEKGIVEVKESVAANFDAAANSLDAALAKVRHKLEEEVAILREEVFEEIGKAINSIRKEVVRSRKDQEFFRTIESARRDGQHNMIRVMAHSQNQDVMRQNVYLIEFLRELLDEEPRFQPKPEPRRWYDHGWR